MTQAHTIPHGTSSQKLDIFPAQISPYISPRRDPLGFGPPFLISDSLEFPSCPCLIAEPGTMRGRVSSECLRLVLLIVESTITTTSDPDYWARTVSYHSNPKVLDLKKQKTKKRGSPQTRQKRQPNQNHPTRPNKAVHKRTKSYCARARHHRHVRTTAIPAVTHERTIPVPHRRGVTKPSPASMCHCIADVRPWRHLSHLGLLFTCCGDCDDWGDWRLLWLAFVLDCGFS